MKRKIRLLVTAVFMTILFSMTAFGAGWAAGQGENSGRWWYDLGDGTWYAGTQGAPSWQWLDGNGDGAWVENGAVQTRRGAAEETTADRNVLVVYFSHTNTTEGAANLIHQQMGGTLFEIHPAENYPSSYSVTTQRVQREISAGTLPAVTGDVENFENYDVVFIGFP